MNGLSWLLSLPLIFEVLILLVLLIVGILIIVVLVKVLLLLLPAAIIALVVWLLTGRLFLAGISFLIISLISILKRK